ncbi:MAG: hypothetical protein WCQ47_03365 [bacterium]
MKYLFFVLIFFLTINFLYSAASTTLPVGQKVIGGTGTNGGGDIEMYSKPMMFPSQWSGYLPITIDTGGTGANSTQNLAGGSSGYDGSLVIAGCSGLIFSLTWSATTPLTNGSNQVPFTMMLQNNIIPAGYLASPLTGLTCVSDTYWQARGYISGGINLYPGDYSGVVTVTMSW